MIVLYRIYLKYKYILFNIYLQELRKTYGVYPKH